MCMFLWCFIHKRHAYELLDWTRSGEGLYFILFIKSSLIFVSRFFIFIFIYFIFFKQHRHVFSSREASALDQSGSEHGGRVESCRSLLAKGQWIRWLCWCWGRDWTGHLVNRAFCRWANRPQGPMVSSWVFCIVFWSSHNFQGGRQKYPGSFCAPSPEINYY